MEQLSSLRGFGAAGTIRGIRPIAARVLAKVGGLSQRQVARQLGLTTGAAVSLQLKRLRENPSPDRDEALRQLLAAFPENQNQLQRPGRKQQRAGARRRDPGPTESSGLSI